MNESISTISGLLVCGILCLSAVGCDDGGAPADEAMGGTSVMTSGGSGVMAGGGDTGGGGGSSTASPGTPVTWDAGGWVDSMMNPLGIQGPFYSYDDCKDAMVAMLPCTMREGTMTGPDMMIGWTAEEGKVCFKGTAAKVEKMNFAAQWGAGVALDFASSGGLMAVKSDFDLVGAGITGFSVDITGTAPAGIRINLTMKGLTESNFVDAPVPGTKTFKLADVKQGSWIKTGRTPLDPTKVEAMQFQVFTKDTAATPFDFCVTGIRALTD